MPTGFQDTDQVVQTEPTQIAESDVKTCSPSITAHSSSTPDDGDEIPAGSRSECEPYRDEIVRKLEQGLTAQRIWQDLIDEFSFAAKYPHSKTSGVSLELMLRATAPPRDEPTTHQAGADRIQLVLYEERR